ncbi:DUF1961 family protein [Lutibacter citreus]|uniref:DUF1961 family protein n=1 Tax=Lutibacter citreus TaxID=2138210 RepID=UPI000DBE845D|nr:DUF1961 family protein [Lutibacter citreus]
MISIKINPLKQYQYFKNYKYANKIYFLLFIVFVSFSFSSCSNKEKPKVKWLKKELLFKDKGTSNWKQKWMLDGEKSKVKNSDEGMELIAGAEHGNDTCHMVLWTKKSFKGNIAIEYDYTRTDTTSRCVNILYFLATGKGDSSFPTDISLWNNKRKVPHMSTYIKNMNTYHISYAAFDANKYSKGNDYIRLRRYNPSLKGFEGTFVPGDHLKTGLFKTNVTYHVEVLKFNNTIEMHIQNKMNTDEKLVCKWNVSKFPPCKSGRIGLRHMYTRSARYKNFKIWSLE